MISVLIVAGAYLRPATFSKCQVPWSDAAPASTVRICSESREIASDRPSQSVAGRLWEFCCAFFHRNCHLAPEGDLRPKGPFYERGDRPSYD